MTILVVAIFFFIIDIRTFKYCSTSVYPVLLVHHIANIFAQFGFLCSDKRLLFLYLFTPILVVIHWKTNNNKCLLTEIVNKHCGYTMYFRDLWFLLGFKQFKYYDRMQKGYLIIAWIIALIKYTALPTVSLQ